MLIALLLACGLTWFRRWRAARAVITTLTFAVLVSAVLPVGVWLVAPLENRFPPPRQLPEHIAGIVVLGGATDDTLSAARKQMVLGSAGERLFAFLELARIYPSTQLLISRGRNGNGRRTGLAKTLLPEFFARHGIESHRFRIEGQSANTFENATLGHRLIKPVSSDNWLLVTSAWHMPRAVGVFRTAGWNIVPYPVDYRTSGSYSLAPAFDTSRGFTLVAMGLREWAALAIYRLRGFTDTWFPAPVKTQSFQ